MSVCVYGGGGGTACEKSCWKSTVVLCGYGELQAADC